MVTAASMFDSGSPLVVGCLAGEENLRRAVAHEVWQSCDLAEIRLDMLEGEGLAQRPWRVLEGVPLMFTARRADEGGSQALAASKRMGMLRAVLDEAACIDIEVASIAEMEPLLAELRTRNIPWVASFHDFDKLPATAVLEDAARRARLAGAGVFKAAAAVHGPADLARLADFQLADHGLPAATMGMGPLAAVSRLLCAQCGSLLNYGYLGSTATAPGQWPAGVLKDAITRLEPVRR